MFIPGNSAPFLQFCRRWENSRVPRYREFLKHLISEPNNQEYKNIFNEITEVRNPLRAEWLDANFKVENKGLFKKGKLYILTENESKKEKLNVKK